MNRHRAFCFKASVAALAAAFSGAPCANPNNPAVVAGSAVFQQSGKTLTVTNTPGAIINWQSFNIDRGELTRFIQQSATSQVLNRVTGGDPSKILGSLQSNGRVILINPNGIAFGAGAQVDVAGLLISSLQIKDADYLAGKLKFNDTPGAGSIKNEGTIKTASGGQVILIAPQVENSGLIHTPEGQILLAAGKSVTIADPDKPAIQVEVSNTEHKAINLGTLIGKEISLYGGLVRNSGTIQATTAVVGENGKISLRAKYEVENTGTLQANGAQGGDIVVQAEQGTARVQGLVEAKALTPQQVSLQQQAIEQKVQAASIVPAENVVVPPPAGSTETSVTLQAEAGVAAPSPLLETPWLKAGASVVIVDSNTPQMTQPTGPLVPLDANPLNPNTPLLPNRQQGQGGSVRIMGRLVRIDDGAAIDATGPGAGGEIVLGGGVSGTATPTPTIVWVGAGATLDASATVNGAGGRIALLADRIAQDGVLRATGATAGEVEITAGQRFIQSQNALIDASGDTDGGSIAIRVGQDQYSGAFVSGTLRADGASGKGGDILVTGRNLHFAAAEISADGATDGGQVRLGGDYQGQNPALANASTNYLNTATHISANGASGQGGRVIVWSDSETTFGGSIEARGGTQAQGGFVEISSKEVLHFAGTVAAKDLLLDPKNIIIDAAGSLASFQLVDPNPGEGNYFGGVVAEVGGGNLVVTAYGDSFAASGAGAAYLFNGATGALISTLRGSQAGDAVGSDVTALANGNYVVRSYDWANGAATGAGAVTWGSGSSGVSGFVSAINSLVGSQAYDYVGADGVTALANGHYVVASSAWANGTATNAGAVTWGNGSGGTVGAVSAANSLVGSQTGDQVGNYVITELSNGHYVVRSNAWANGTATNAGALTWGSGTAGVSGVVSAANSLLGTQEYEGVGNWEHFVALANGDYVAALTGWNGNRGAVVLMDGATGRIKADQSLSVSGANGVVGEQLGDRVGGWLTALTNGNVVVASPDWHGGGGAVTVIDGASGRIAADQSRLVATSNSLTGVGYLNLTSMVTLPGGDFLLADNAWNNTRGAVAVVDGASGRFKADQGWSMHAGNSLTGTQIGDYIGWRLTTLANGNVVVASPNWHNNNQAGAGAVTWINATTLQLADGSPLAGSTVSASNSLVGSQAGDGVGNGIITALANGNYVVTSASWANGGATYAGAVTWGNGSSGTVGVVSAANSLVGSQSWDMNAVRVTELANGHYVVTNEDWDRGAIQDAGAVTWGNGNGGVSGVISAANSLVGSQNSDSVGGGITALANGNYVVHSPFWSNGGLSGVGALTWGNGNTGIVGTVSAANSLIGSVAGANLGLSSHVTALTNGNYVVAASDWNSNRGAVALMDGGTGRIQVDQTLTMSAANSLVGGLAGDRVGYGGVTVLSDDSYVVSSPNWSANRGAVTWVDAGGSLTGLVAGGNSLVGSQSGDQVGTGGVTVLDNGNFVVNSPNWANGVLGAAGAVTWVNGVTRTLADGSNLAGSAVSAANSLVGSQAGDQVGRNGVVALTNGNYVVRSSHWANGAATFAGAVTWGNGSTGTLGTVSAANSLVGSQANDMVGNYGVTALSNGNYVVRSSNWANGTAINAGAVTWGNGSGGTVGAVSAANSLVGSQAGDYVGETGVTALANGHYVVQSVGWANGTATHAGAVTWGNGNGGTVGAVSAANSLVGSQADDYVGNANITELANGNYVVGSPLWDNGSLTNTGAVTWGNGGSGVAGVVSAGNSIVGRAQNQSVGWIVQVGNGDYVVPVSNGSWYGGAAWVNGATGQVRLAGSVADRVGSGRVTALSNGNFVVASPEWNNGAATNAGAATWGDGNGGNVGAVSAANSLVGSQAYDFVGAGGVTALANGNYVVRSYHWANGAANSAGAVTWGNGSGGTVGAVSAANSLVGSQANDFVGNQDVTSLANGNYVVASSYWANGAATNAGAVTWGNGNGGTVGAVSAANSLVGSQTNDYVGSYGITELANGNYVVVSSNWANGAATNAGAVTWGNGNGGTVGAVSAANSLVGSQTNDYVGQNVVTALANGNYVVASPEWDNGAAADAGAVTWGNGNGGTVGAVSTANSLTGSQAGDYVGGWVDVLANGNFVVSSNWHNNAGSVTWVNGSTLKLADGSDFAGGVIAGGNSLLGSQANDYVGSGFLQLANGNYVVSSPEWANGTWASAGRVDVMPGIGGIFAQTFALNPAATATLNPAALTASLDAGTAVTLQANNDITINSAIVTAAGGSGGALTMQAGRSININANITTDNGSLTLSANDPGANASYRDAGTANITMAPGTSINTGTGTLNATLNGGSGTITWRDVTAGDVTANGATRNLGTTTLTSLDMSGGDLTLGAGASFAISGLANIAAGNTLDLSGGSFSAGSLGVSGILNLNGGSLTTGATTIANGGVFTLTSGTASFAGPLTLQAGGTLNYGLAGATTIPGASTQAGTLNINSGTLNFTGGLTQTAGATMIAGGTLGGNFAVSGGTLGGAGNITGNLGLTAGSYTLAAGDVLTVGGTTTLAAGASLNLNGGGLLSSGLTLNGALTYTAGSFNSGGPLTINSGASFTKAGAGTLTLSTAFNELAGGSFAVNGGTLDLAAGGSLQGGTYAPAAGATLRFSSGTFTLNGATTLGPGIQLAGGTFNGPGSLGNTGTLAITGNTTFNTAFTNSGTVTLSNGVTLNATGGYTQTAGSTALGTGAGSSATLTAAGGFALNGGTLSGSGTINGDLNVGAATVATGFSPGALNITGNLTLAAGSTMSIEVGGTAAGSGFDVINVSGVATLDGTLNVSSYAGYTPAAGTNYSFMNFGSSSGAFSTTNLPGGWSISLNSYATYLDLLAAGVLAAPAAASTATVVAQANALTAGETAVGFDRVEGPTSDVELVQSLALATQFAQNDEEFLSVRQCQ